MKKLKLLLFILTISFLFLSCNDVIETQNQTTTLLTTEETTDFDKSITLDKTSIEMSLGSGYQMGYALNFELMNDETIIFESQNPEIITVNDEGFLYAKGYGETEIIVSYLDVLEVEVSVLVSSYYEIKIPDQKIYQLNETVDLSDATISFYRENGQEYKRYNLDNSIILDQGLQSTGTRLLEIDFNGFNYYHEIERLSEKQYRVFFDDFIYIGEDHYVGEKIEFILFNNDTDGLLGALNNVYDYSEINIYAEIDKPSQNQDTIYAFWYQDFSEIVSDVIIDPSLKLEGTVNDTDDDYDVLVRFKTEGNAHFRLRYMPQEAGEYNVNLYVEVDGVLIQTFEKNIEVQAQRDETYRGFVRVESYSNSHFIFDNQDSYLPVGQNLAWYTSVQRKHYDYKHWLSEMSDVGMNYSRIWMAAWGFSPFWDDIYNFDQRQTNLFSLDQTIEMADLEDIYIQLCLLHHGMFSQEVNPMWKDSEINWYTSKYGTNPYADVIDDPGLFFTDDAMIANFKNQLKYIIARYGYSDHIMAFEIFNEVDWIESYTVTDGLVWHQEMADYLKEIDANDHLVTTSLKNIDYDSQSYKVFMLKNIDYINVHAYGIYNHTQYLPNTQYYIQNKFNKPVMFNEIGYSGYGGKAQIEADPNNVTLHQGLWAGAMGGGLGTGMHWWWESWIDTYDVYDAFKGVSTYLSQIDLTGPNQEIVYSQDYIADDVQLDSNVLGYMGYKYTDRLYLYIYDKTYNLDNQVVGQKQNIHLNVSDLTTATYMFKAYDTLTGELIDSWSFEINQETVQLTLPNFSQDIAIIIEMIGS